MSAAYLDNAASTRPAGDVLACVAAAARQHFANPSSAHAAGAAATRELENSRQVVANALGAAAGDVIFTAGGTEANALAVLGAAACARGRHLVVTAIEHPAVLRNAERLAKRDGFSLTQVAVNADGVVDVGAVMAAVRPDTAVVAVMFVNNELGTVQPVAAVGQALAARAAEDGRRAPHFHVDAVQAFGFIPVRPPQLGADSLAISGHKIHGPKGTGALWLRPGARVAALWEGGGQERGLRSGTEDVAGIAGLARSVTLAVAARAEGVPARVAALRDQLEALVFAAIPSAFPTVTGAPRAPHISSVSLPSLPAEPLLHALEARGVFASAGSACASKARGPSHVLKAVGVRDDTAVLRFSLSRETTSEEVHAAAVALTQAYAEIAGAGGIRGARLPNRI